MKLLIFKTDGKIHFFDNPEMIDIFHNKRTEKPYQTRFGWAIKLFSNGYTPTYYLRSCETILMSYNDNLVEKALAEEISNRLKLQQKIERDGKGFKNGRTSKG